MQKPGYKVLLFLAVGLGGIFFLFSTDRSLADVFFFLGAIIAIVTLFRQSEDRYQDMEYKKKVSERIEELEYRLENIEERLGKP